MMSQKSQFIYSHKKQYRLEVTQKVSFCYRCSTAIIKDKSGNEITAIKPLRYHIPQETCIPIFLTISDKHNPYLFYNKSDYIKIRRDIVKQMKLFCQYFELSKKTFFLAFMYYFSYKIPRKWCQRDASKKTFYENFNQLCSR